MNIKQWLVDNTNNDEVEFNTLVNMFEQTFNREVTDLDIQSGLWSLLCDHYGVYYQSGFAKVPIDKIIDPPDRFGAHRGGTGRRVIKKHII